jgi:tRNA threonylcarbamoyladenosine biosynthesis protein TsaE
MDVVFNLDTINETAVAFLKHISNKKVIALHGQMGAGKTTFVHAICESLLVKGNISSPTFSIINEYHTANNDVVFHIDLYRLKSAREAINAGVEDCLYSNNLCIVEWPEIAPELFPDNTVHCYLTVNGENARRLIVR